MYTANSYIRNRTVEWLDLRVLKHDIFFKGAGLSRGGADYVHHINNCPPPYFQIFRHFNDPDEYEIGPQLRVPRLEKFAVQCTVGWLHIWVTQNIKISHGFFCSIVLVQTTNLHKINLAVKRFYVWWPKSKSLKLRPLKGYSVGSKECYIYCQVLYWSHGTFWRDCKYFFLSMCLFLSMCFPAVNNLDNI